MNEILTIVLDNIYIVLAFFGLFAICVIADIIAKTFYNVNNVGESFSIEKFMTGILIKLNDRPDIIFENGTFYGGLHCGECLSVFKENVGWVPVRLEF